jgi:hypothetical protein
MSVDAVVELRQYTLRPGRRDELIELFDRQFVESQEALGMAIRGQFRDLDAPDRFVWLRGFADLADRASALTSFYSGPVWKAHAARANATMVDTDDVLLLRPATPDSGFPVPAEPRPPVGPASAPTSVLLATLHHGDRPFDGAFVEFFLRRMRPSLTAAGAAPIACLVTEYADNDFPALPVRTGVHTFAWFARFPGRYDLDDYLARAAEVEALAGTETHHLRLAPTARSLLR